MDSSALAALRHGIVIPAHPLALTAARKLDERRQRALARYYIAAGAGGLAVGVHTTQFRIREPSVGLYEPVLAIAAEEMNRADRSLSPPRSAPMVRVAGVAGRTVQAVAEANVARRHGYHAVLLSLWALNNAAEEAVLDHCRAVGDTMPLVGFYLQTAVGGRVLSHSFWRRFAEIPAVVAIKVAPFSRYQTLDVIRAIAESGRDDIALYTGNDDNIVLDLLTPYRFSTVSGAQAERRIVGGLLGHWACWTTKAVELHEECHRLVKLNAPVPSEMLRKSIAVTDSNAALFDAANQFRGCIAGIHEVLRRQRLLEGIWCLDENETLGPGQLQEIERVYRSYPDMSDDAFVAEHRDRWLTG